MTDRERVIAQAVMTYGKARQTDKAIEEMAELTQALIKLRICEYTKKPDHGAKLMAVLEEIADAEIMLRQLRKIYDLTGLVDGMIDDKLERLADKLIEESEHELG